jgi:hypothetical protein
LGEAGLRRGGGKEEEAWALCWRGEDDWEAATTRKADQWKTSERGAGVDVSEK